jgi:hypothetical protein
MLAFDRALIERDRIAFDRASARSFDADGRMHVADCRITKANVCPYYGREIPNGKALGLDPNRVYMLYRDPEELKLAADSFRNLQLLMVHARVSAKDPKSEVTVGTVGEVAFDGKYLVSKQLTVWDQDGITLIESDEASELSSSYRYRADMTPGRSPEGVAYDGVMRDIKGNHVALVRTGRAGSDVAVNDALPLELQSMKRPHLLARLVALGVVAEPADDAARIALDAALAAHTTCDAQPDDDMEDDPENPGKRRKKAAGKPMTPRDGKEKAGFASDAELQVAVDAAITARGYVSKEDAQKMANDAATKATADAVASVNALHEARELVKPLVGTVAMDSAEAVYRFALEKEGVALDGVHASAFPALVRERIARKTATPTKAPALEALNTVANVLPGLGRISVG